MRRILQLGASVGLLVTGWAVATPSADTYPRQPLDVEHYRFGLVLSDATDRIVGDATVRVRMLAADVRTVLLDLGGLTAQRGDRGMRVDGVSVDGAPSPFTHAGDRLAITLPSPSRDRQRLELGIRYSGIPATGLQIKPNKHGDRTFFSDNWPDKARQWLPTIDHVGDKATMEMVVTAPAHYQVISNGRRVEETDLTGGLRRTVWHEAVPISPWLYALGVARFAVQHVGDYAGVPIETWVFAQDREAGFHDFAVPTRDAMAFYSEWVGPYSYEKLANVQSNSVSGGMESASAIFYAPGSVVGDRNVRWRNVIIHEVAHQWFGNAVTEHDWDDVWLSEGFATYFTQLFIEHAYGRDEFAENMRRSRQTILDFYAKTPDYRIVHDSLDDMARVTTGMTYQKGAWVLHMLRQRVGDDRFWSGIRTYYQRYKDATASTTDFREVMEQASGQDLEAFFQQWLYQGGVPRLEAAWTWDAAARTVTVELRQTQATWSFSVPVEVAILSGSGTTRVERVEMTGPTTRATFQAGQEPSALEIDPHVRLLAAMSVVRHRD